MIVNLETIDAELSKTKQLTIFD